MGGADTERGGFTLVELLVVIGIIALLGAIIFPAFAQAREKARGSSCLSNCRQIGLAVLMYADDYDDHIVPWQMGIFDPALPRPMDHIPGWPTLLAPYVKNRGVFHCPSFSWEKERAIFAKLGYPDSYFQDPWWPLTVEPDGATYGIQVPGTCACLGTRECPRCAWAGSGYGMGDATGLYIYRTMGEIIRPAETCLISEGAMARSANGWGFMASNDLGWGMHFDGQNLIFLDGHAKFVKGRPTKVVFQDADGVWNATYYSWDR